MGLQPLLHGISRREVLALQLAHAPTEHEYWIHVRRQAMACRFEITLSGEDGHWVPAAREALDEVDRLESTLSVFRDTSELVRVNASAALKPVRVDQELFGLLSLCQKLHRQTKGAFDITSTPLSRCWGFLRREGRRPSAEEIAAARCCVGMDGVDLDESSRTVHFRQGMELNLGAIGKGFALASAGAVLRRRGVQHALLSAGGSSVLAIGGRREGWVVDIRSRQARRDRLARLLLRDAALGTSGAGEQFVDVEGTRYGHILDPRTGWPASGILSATAVVPNAAMADALSTAFLIGGTELAKSYCASQPRTLALVTPDDGLEQPQVFGDCPGAVVEAT